MHELSTERRAVVLHHLMENASVRGTSRLTGVNKNTILSLIIKLGDGCTWLHNRIVRTLRIRRIECDELHGYVHTREHHLRGNEPAEYGEQWLYLAIASTSKLLISYRVGKRCEADTDAFIRDVRGRLAVIPELNTDGLATYEPSVRRWFSPMGPGGPGSAVDYSQLVKSFPGKKSKGKDADKYAPKREGPPNISKRAVFGTPNMDATSTSFIERINGTVRNSLRRFVRRTAGFSKSMRHHTAMVAIFAAFYNFCRIHETIRVTPAMEAGLTNHVWSVEELVEVALGGVPCEPPTPQPLESRPEPSRSAERKTSTGAVLRAVDGGKARPKRRELRPGDQATIWTVLREAQRQEEEKGKPPPDTPGG